MTGILFTGRRSRRRGSTRRLGLAARYGTGGRARVCEVSNTICHRHGGLFAEYLKKLLDGQQ